MPGSATSVLFCILATLSLGVAGHLLPPLPDTLHAGSLPSDGPFLSFLWLLSLACPYLPTSSIPSFQDHLLFHGSQICISCCGILHHSAIPRALPCHTSAPLPRPRLYPEAACLTRSQALRRRLRASASPGFFLTLHTSGVNTRHPHLGMWLPCVFCRPPSSISLLQGLIPGSSPVPPLLDCCSPSRPHFSPFHIPSALSVQLRHRSTLVSSPKMLLSIYTSPSRFCLDFILRIKVMILKEQAS